MTETERKAVDTIRRKLTIAEMELCEPRNINAAIEAFSAIAAHSAAMVIALEIPDEQPSLFEPALQSAPYY